MKRILIILMMTLITAAVTTFPAAAQKRVTVTQNKYAFKDGLVYVDMLISMNGADIPVNSYVLLTPVIQLDSISKELPSVIINGTKRQKAYNRLVALNREPLGAGLVINQDEKETHRTYSYSVSVPFEPWMREADFALREDQCECNGPLVKMRFDLIVGRMLDMNRDVPLNLAVSFREPSPEPIKTRSETGKAYIDFAVNKYDLNLNFSKNAFEIGRIGDMIQNVNSNPDIINITEVIIDGYASPEGTYENNMTLSEKRVTALKNYLKAKYRIDEKLFRVKGHGEDWTTLEELIASSYVEYRDDALEIIRNTADHDERERKLMRLQGGFPYREMFDVYYPLLRRVDYELCYTVIPFTIEESKKKLETNPSHLSLNEMFLIAQTYPAGSPEFRRIFDIAAHTYPASEIANFNAAANALDARELNTAKKYMDILVTQDAAYQNNMGILAALHGKYNEASAHFRKAIEGGNKEAAENLAEIEKVIRQFTNN